MMEASNTYRNYTSDIIDKYSGKTLEEILSNYNSYFLSYDGSVNTTRLQIVSSLRRPGLKVTYILNDNTIVEEIYIGTNIDNASWIDDNNWINSNKTLLSIEDTVKSKISEIKTFAENSINNVHTSALRKYKTPSGDPMHYYYEEFGALWNNNTRYWEMNTITDLTNKDMRLIVKAGRFSNVARQFLEAPGRTVEAPTFISSGYLDLSYYYSGCKSEVIKYYEDSQRFISNASHAFYKCLDLATIIGILQPYSADPTLFNNTFEFCPKLTNVNIYKLKQNISFETSPLLSNESILYMIENADNTSTIKITLEKTAYIRAMEDINILEALKLHPLITLVSN